LLAAFASAIVPGVGQMLAGETRRGGVLLGIDLGLLATVLVFFNDRVDVLTAAVEPSTLALLMILNIGLLGFRVWAADDAYRTARRAAGGVDRGSGSSVVVAGVVLGAVLLVPHVVFGYYDLVQYNLLNDLFGGNEASDTTATTTTAAGGGPTSSTAPGETTTTTVAAGPEIWNGLDRLNILLLGGDFGVGRTGVRTDTMITVSIDPESGDVAMFSVPRNWTYAPLPEGMGVWDCNCYPELMNELWAMGEEHPNAFPGPGTPSENAVKGINSAFLGIPIHYYALVNLDGFVDIIDSIGGVDIYVPEQVIDEEYPHEDGTVERIQIDAGDQHLDGHLALAYARTRHQDSDYFRMNRQRCVLEAVLDQAEPTDLLLNFQHIADVIKNSVQTDIPLEALPELVTLLPDIDRDEILSIAFIPPEYHLKFREDGKEGRVPNVELVHEHVELILDDPARAIEELGLDTLDDSCATGA
jgi:polyisoprenyl-teichoic acid--peptidoglycan teichoic acid transferase